ncbi:type I phosphodiesterase / nucleotide pyrophosphatase, partial [Necator americanus]
MLYVLLFHLVTLPLISTLSAHPKLIIIAFDGFRYDFMNVTLVPNIYDWALGGAWFVNGVRSQYVSFTATNFMAISTGLYTESHGIVSNKFFDHSNGKLYDIWNFTNTPGIVETSLEPEWYRGEPIWLTNERPWERFRSFDEWLSDVDTIVELFTRPKDPVNFLAWYIAEPDHTLHLNGFYNGEYEKMLKKLDELFLYFIRKMEEFGLNKEVNVIFTADHGHAQIDGYKNIMCVKDYINVKTIIDGQSMIYTFNTDLLEEVYENLTSAVKTNGFKVKIYKKEKFPPRYHYTGMSSRIGEIILEPEIGWDVNFECTREEMKRKYGGQKLHSSTHGMDPNEPEMHATLVLVGPDIPPKQLVRRIPQNIDLYGLMCYLLDIQPSPNNGSMTTFLKNVNFTNKQQS